LLGVLMSTGLGCFPERPPTEEPAPQDAPTEPDDLVRDHESADAGSAHGDPSDGGSVVVTVLDAGINEETPVTHTSADASVPGSWSSWDGGAVGPNEVLDAGAHDPETERLDSGEEPEANISFDAGQWSETAHDAGMPPSDRCAPEFYDHDNNYWTDCLPCTPPCGPFSYEVQNCESFQNRICECQTNFVENENGDCVKEIDSGVVDDTYHPNDSDETPDGDDDNTHTDDEDIDNGDDNGANDVQSTASFAATPLWSLTFQDEFNGPQPGDDLSCYSRTPQCLFHNAWGPIDCPEDVAAQMADLNKCVWSVYDFYNYMNGFEEASAMKNAFSASEVKVENGNLVLSARTQGSSHDDCGQWYDDERTDGYGNYTVDCPLLSGGVHSRHYSWGGNVSVEGFLQKHGRFEVRARLPGGPGAWPAIWMLPQGGGWPDGGEIDIMEAWAHRRAKVYHTYHDGIEDQGIKTAAGMEHKARSRFYPQSGRDDTFDDDFHVYAVEWDENELRFFVDKWYVGTIRNGDMGEMGDDFAMEVPTLANYILLNYTMTADIGTWAGNVIYNYRPDLDDFQPREMLIDYVRVYEKHNPEMSIACPWGGSYDGANCSVASLPSGVAVYIKDSSLYSIAANSAPYCPQGGTHIDGECLHVQMASGAPTFIWSDKFYVGAGNEESTLTHGCRHPCEGHGVYDGYGCYVGSAPDGHVARIENGSFYYRITGWDDFWGGDNDCFETHPEDDDGCLFAAIPENRDGFVNKTNEGARLSLESFYLEPLCEPFDHLSNCANPCPVGGRYKYGECFLMKVPDGANGFIYDDNFYLSKNTDADPCPYGGLFDGANCKIYEMPAGHSGRLEGDDFIINPSCERIPYEAGTGY